MLPSSIGHIGGQRRHSGPFLMETINKELFYKKQMNCRNDVPENWHLIFPQVIIKFDTLCREVTWRGECLLVGVEWS